MKNKLVVLVLFSLTVGLSAFGLKGTVRSSFTNYADSILADRKHYIDELRIVIKGKENMPSDSVFKNIKLLKGVPAARLLSIMDKGWANSLGVSCGYCHQNEQWEADTKPAKEITRKMTAMTATINNQLLKGIDGLKGPNAIVNCTTCHRGSTKPALQLPVSPAN